MRNLIALAALTMAPSIAAVAQEKSVNPGMNKPFKPPNVAEFIQRFEKEDRDVSDNREKAVKACGIKAGITVADIGAGIGLFSRMVSPAVGPAGKVYAVETAEEFVAHIDKLARQQELENIVGAVCKPDSIELSPESIDLAFICNTDHPFEFPQKAGTGAA